MTMAVQIQEPPTQHTPVITVTACCWRNLVHGLWLCLWP
jgi:hypothetical protein